MVGLCLAYIKKDNVWTGTWYFIRHDWYPGTWYQYLVHRFYHRYYRLCVNQPDQKKSVGCSIRHPSQTRRQCDSSRKCVRRHLAREEHVIIHKEMNTFIHEYVHTCTNIPVYTGDITCQPSNLNGDMKLWWLLHTGVRTYLAICWLCRWGCCCWWIKKNEWRSRSMPCCISKMYLVQFYCTVLWWE